MKLNKNFLATAFAFCLGSGTVHAATVSYIFDVSVDSGPRSGSVFSGGFGYDDTGLNGSGEEYLALDNFTFHFDGGMLTLADDPSAEAAFYDGVLLGIGYNVTVPAYSLSFMPGFLDLGEAYFAYDLSDEGAGFGSLAVQAVPVPGALPLLLSGIGALVGVRGHRRRRN